MKLLLLIWHFPRRIVCGLIRIYQKTLSPDHGLFKVFYPHGFCRFQPTCSEYGYEAVKKKGVMLGGAKTAWRILRCNPCSKGGYDPVK